MDGNISFSGCDSIILLVKKHDTSFAYITDKQLVDRTQIYGRGERESEVIKENLGTLMKQN